MLLSSLSITDSGTVIVIITLAFFAGGVVKGILGIGLPLVAMPVSALVIPIPTAIALTIVPILISNCWQVIDSGYLKPALSRFGSLILVMAIMALIGARWLSGLDDVAAQRVVGSLLLVFCALQLMPIKITLSAATERWTNPLMGFCGGLVGGASGIFSLIASYLLMLDLTKDQFVGTIALIYLIAGVALYVGLSNGAHVGLVTLGWSTLATLPVATGILVGRRLRSVLQAAHFRLLLITVLAVIGVSLIGRSW